MYLIIQCIFNLMTTKSFRQRRIFISNKPTFIYLQKGHSVTLLCPKLPPPFLPVTWDKLVKGRYSPIFSGPSFTLEFPSHHDTGLVKCSFISNRKKYEHTFILAYHNIDAVTLRPTAFTFTNTRTQIMSTSPTTSTHTTVQHTTTVQTTTKQLPPQYVRFLHQHHQ